MLVCSILHTSIELANIAHTGIVHTHIMHTDTVHTNIVYTSIEAEGFCRGVFTAGFDWGNLDYNCSHFFFAFAAFIAYNLLKNRLYKENKSNGMVEYILCNKKEKKIWKVK
jgi:hypothetical protein